MLEVLRSDARIIRNLVSDGTRPIEVGSNHGFYVEAVVYHTFQRGLFAKLHDGVTIRVNAVHAADVLPTNGQITIHVRARTMDGKSPRNDAGVVNNYWVINIPQAVIEEGPVYIPELNAVLHMEHQQDLAIHPGNVQAVKTFVDAQVAKELRRYSHNGIIIRAVDYQRRLRMIYTEIHGRIVSIPVSDVLPTEAERKLINQGKLSCGVDERGNAVCPYEMISITYITDQRTDVKNSNRVAIERYLFSIPDLLKQSPSAWKLSGNWFAGELHAMREKLQEERGLARIRAQSYSREALDNAVELATKPLNEQIESMTTELGLTKERLKRSEAALQAAKDLPEKIADGTYDLHHHLSMVPVHQLISFHKAAADVLGVEATTVKATATIEKARLDAHGSHHADSVKFRQAQWEAIGHLAKTILFIGMAIGSYQVTKTSKRGS